MSTIEQSVIDRICAALEKGNLNIADAIKTYTGYRHSAAFYRKISREQITQIRQAKTTQALKGAVWAKGSPRMMGRKYTHGNTTQLPYGPQEPTDDEDDYL